MISTNDILDPLVVNIIKECPGNLVFDYGCGYTDQIWKIRDLGKSVVGYDISGEYIQIQKNKGLKGRIEFITSSEFKERYEEFKGFFDIVNCSLVLCSIPDENEITEIMINIYDILKNNGCAIVSICNPLSVFNEESIVQKRIIPQGVSYNDKFCYEKKIKLTGNIRKDYHRPVGFYEKLFHKTGFKIERIYQTPMDKFGSSDFMVFKLTKKR